MDQVSAALLTAVSGPGADPSCAIGYWGAAMTYYHPLWAPPTDEEFAAGRQAVQAAQAAATKSPRDQLLIDALA